MTPLVAIPVRNRLDLTRPLVEALEALGDAVVGGSDLVRVDGVALLPGPLRVPEDERPAAQDARAHVRVGQSGLREVVDREARLQAGRLDAVHVSMMILAGSIATRARGGSPPR